MGYAWKYSANGAMIMRYIFIFHMYESHESQQEARKHLLNHHDSLTQENSLTLNRAEHAARDFRTSPADMLSKGGVGGKSLPLLDKH